MMKGLMMAGLMCGVTLGLSAQTPGELVGSYQMEVDGGDRLDLRADGSARLGDEETSWAARAGQLTLGQETVPYRVSQGRLFLKMGPMELSWRRLGSAAAASTPLQRAATKAAQAPGQSPMQSMGGVAAPAGARVGATAQHDSPQDAQSRQVLMSSAWCSFTYNKTSGTSTTRRAVFRADGILSIGGGAESYSSGRSGSYAGQSASNTNMRWLLQSQRLYVDAGDGSGMQDVGLTATQNSNGSIILRADGREYAMCQ